MTELRFGQTKRTRSGRALTLPDTKGLTLNRRLDQVEHWLVVEAIQEALALHDRVHPPDVRARMLVANERADARAKVAKPPPRSDSALSPDDIDTLNDYLFDPSMKLPSYADFGFLWKRHPSAPRETSPEKTT